MAELYRSCHNLNGSMAMARVQIGMPLTEGLNHLVSLAYSRPARPPPGAVDTLRDVAARIEALLAYLTEPWRPAPATADLEQRLADHVDAIEHLPETPLEQTGEPVGVETAMADEAPVADDSIIVEELVMPEVIELTAEKPVVLAPPEAEPFPETPVASVPENEPISALVTFPMAEQEAESVPEPVAALPVELPPELPAAAAPSLFALPSAAVPPAESLPYDPEIAAIFAEEAAELLEASDTAVARLADASGAAAEQALADLQRYLHTLKGGARMAGLTVMGDFSHELETPK